jgi:hypothetical protein
MRIAALLVTLVLIATSREARADLDNPFPDSTVVSPGFKLGYTFGKGGGFTSGLEVTVLWRNGPDLEAIVAHGPALNLTWRRHGAFDARLGWEAVSWFVGLELGPSLVHDANGTHVGLGISPWLGALVVPYYTYTYLFDGAPMRELGSYFKLPICTGCSGGGGGDDWDWDDDDF